MTGNNLPFTRPNLPRTRPHKSCKVQCILELNYLRAGRAIAPALAKKCPHFHNSRLLRVLLHPTARRKCGHLPHRHCTRAASLGTLGSLDVVRSHKRTHYHCLRQEVCRSLPWAVRSRRRNPLYLSRVARSAPNAQLLRRVCTAPN